jgi:hypothetical protein
MKFNGSAEQTHNCFNPLELRCIDLVTNINLIFDFSDKIILMVSSVICQHNIKIFSQRMLMMMKQLQTPKDQIKN